MDKQALRKAISQKKQEMSEACIESYSRDLAQQLYRHPFWQNAKSVFAYVAYNQEVRTLPILKQALEEGRRVAVPKLFGSQMKFLWLEDLTKLAPGSYQIPEPVYDEPEADDAAALMLVPGLAFDSVGNRCGYGGGFYDRYLKEHPTHPTIALCYHFQFFEHLETDAFDLPVDCVLINRI